MGGGGGPSCLAGEHKYCNIKVDSSTESALLVEDLYDTKGEFIGSAAMMQDKIVVTSGRFVGIDAYEEYKKTFYVTMNPQCIKGELVDMRVLYLGHVQRQALTMRAMLWVLVALVQIRPLLAV